MAKKNTEVKEKPAAAVELKEPEAPPAAGDVENGANIPNTPRSHEVIEARDEYIAELRAEAAKFKDEADQMHAAALGCMNVPLSGGGRVQDVKNVLDILCAQRQELQARVAELQLKTGEAPLANGPADPAAVPVADLAAAAYDLFRKNQTEGDFPSWDALDTPTQKLWRDSYAHVAGGGAPRTDFEQAVKYLLTVAE